MTTHVCPYQLRPRSMKRRCVFEEDDDQSDESDSDYDPMRSQEDTSDGMVSESEDESDYESEDDEEESEDESEGDYETDTESESESESDEEEGGAAGAGYNYRCESDVSKSTLRVLKAAKKYAKENPHTAPPGTKPIKKYKDHMRRFSPREKNYFLSISDAEQEQLFQKYKDLTNDAEIQTPFRFQVLSAPIEKATKLHILSRMDQFVEMNDGSGDYHKYQLWIDSISRMPLGKYHTLSIENVASPATISQLLSSTRSSLDEVVYGHKEAKEHIVRILAQWISNPAAKGHCIGIQGPMGIGKTTLLKEGVSKALGIPFGFIPLGGASDAAFLEGHGFTYEGSTYGRISEVLMKANVMNPIIFFDELDKVSDTPKGEEIASILTHLTDASQNDKFTDRFFGEIELDLSKAIMVFSFNDESKINPVLKDRMTVIHVNGYERDEKIKIATNYLMPDILKQYNMLLTDVMIDQDVFKYIIERVPAEKGVRNLRRGLDSIVSWLNMARYIPTSPFTEVISFPITIGREHVDNFVLKTQNDDMGDYIKKTMYL